MAGKKYILNYGETDEHVEINVNPNNDYIHITDLEANVIFETEKTLMFVLNFSTEVALEISKRITLGSENIDSYEDEIYATTDSIFEIEYDKTTKDWMISSEEFKYDYIEDELFIKDALRQLEKYIDSSIIDID